MVTMQNGKWKMTQMFIVYFSLRFPYCLSVKALQVISFTNVRYIYLVNQDQMYSREVISIQRAEKVFIPFLYVIHVFHYRDIQTIIELLQVIK